MVRADAVVDSVALELQNHVLKLNTLAVFVDRRGEEVHHVQRKQRLELDGDGFRAHLHLDTDEVRWDVLKVNEQWRVVVILVDQLLDAVVKFAHLPRGTGTSGLGRNEMYRVGAGHGELLKHRVWNRLVVLSLGCGQFILKLLQALLAELLALCLDACLLVVCDLVRKLL